MHFMKLRSAAPLAAIAIGSVIAFAGCGGGAKKVDADDWVDAVCDAAKDYQKESDKASEKFFDIDPDDSAKAKKTLLGLLEDTKDASDEFRKEFDKTGKPDLKSGDAVLKAFKEQFKENDKNAEELKKLVDDINVKKDFEPQFLKIADAAPDTDFRGRLDDVVDDEDDAQEIIDLIDEDPECAAVLFDEDSVSEPSSNPTPTVRKSPVAASTPSAPKNATEKWAAGICTSLVGWVKDIEGANNTLQANLSKFNSSKDSPAALKQELVTFLKAGQTETKNLKKEIDGMKAPDVKDGAKIHQVFVKAGADLVTAFDQAVADAQKINASSYSAVEADIEGFETKILDAFDEVGAALEALEDYKSADVQKAFESRPECADLS